jgi:hypothetical protein
VFRDIGYSEDELDEMADLGAFGDG